LIKEQLAFAAEKKDFLAKVVWLGIFGVEMVAILGVLLSEHKLCGLARVKP
jgi:hypothetical protein